MKTSRIDIEKLFECEDPSGTAVVCGWVRNNRCSGSVGFLEVHDGR